MAKAKTAKVGRKTRVVRLPRIPNKAVRQIRPQTRTFLDPAAKALAELIRDPCNAPLTTTIWPGSDGCLVSRFESDFVQFSGSTEVAGVLAWAPGAPLVYINSGSAMTSDALGSVLGAGAPAPPGGTFLGAVASSVRCVSACLQVSFPGTELNRSGIVGLGVASFGTVAPNLSTASGGGNVAITAGQMRQLCSHTERMPEEMAEITWFPGPGDQDFFQIAGTEVNTNYVDSAQQKNAILCSVSGFPVNTGVRFRLVAVYEWVPRSAQGLISTQQPPKSHNTLNDVLMALHQSGGPSWFINTYKKVRPYVQAVARTIDYGAKVLGPALAAF